MDDISTGGYQSITEVVRHVCVCDTRRQIVPFEETVYPVEQRTLLCLEFYFFKMGT